MPNSFFSSSQDKLYQFDLSPDDEAEQVAATAVQRGAHHAMIIAPDSALGKRMVDHFKKTFEKAGGSVTVNVTYTPKTVLKEALRDALQFNEHPEKSELPPGISVPTTHAASHHRQDVDMIFMVASPDMARQINPLLKFYYAGDIPTYSTSLVFSGIQNIEQDKDLNGIVFSDMPWIIKQEGTQSDRYQRFVAMGMDAFTLSQRLPRLALLPTLPVSGVTGKLYVGDDGQIVRRVSLGRFVQGKPALVHSP